MRTWIEQSSDTTSVGLKMLPSSALRNPVTERHVSAVTAPALPIVTPAIAATRAMHSPNRGKRELVTIIP